MGSMSAIETLSDAALIEKFEALSQKEIETTVELLLHLAEVDRRKLFLDAAYSSMFDYCTRKLGYSEGAAHRRITGARLMSQYPELKADLLAKTVSLTTLTVVAGILNKENFTEVLARIRGKSRREVEEYASRYRPRKELPRARVRPVAVAKQAALEMASLFGMPCGKKSSINPASASESGRKVKENEGLPEPVVEQRFEFRFTVSADLKHKFDEAQLCLSGKYPKGATVEQVFEAALELVLEKHSPKRRQARRVKRAQKQAHKPERETKPGSPGRRVPQDLRDQVFERDGGCCTFVSKDGVRCQERAGLELHHEVPHGQGGADSLDNLSLRCAVHNKYHALQDYGGEHMQQYLGAGWEGAVQRFLVKETARVYDFFPQGTCVGLSDFKSHGASVSSLLAPVSIRA